MAAALGQRVGPAERHQVARVGLEQQVAGRAAPRTSCMLAVRPAPQHGAHRRGQVADVARGHGVQALGAITSSSMGRSAVAAPRENEREIVWLMRCMRSTSTDSASRRCWTVAWPAICASEGSRCACTGAPSVLGSCMRPAPTTRMRSAQVDGRRDGRGLAHGTIAKVLVAFIPRWPLPGNDGNGGRASRCSCVMRSRTARRAKRTQGRPLAHPRKT